MQVDLRGALTTQNLSYIPVNVHSIKLDSMGHLETNPVDTYICQIINYDTASREIYNPNKFISDVTVNDDYPIF